MPKPVGTHRAYVLKRETRVSGRWIEIGTAKIETDGRNSTHHIHLDRLPVGGFSGHIILHPNGSMPIDPEPEPERPEREHNE